MRGTKRRVIKLIRLVPYQYLSLSVNLGEINEKGKDSEWRFGRFVPKFLGRQMAWMFVLSFQGTKFPLPKERLFPFFDHHPELMTATSYDVKSAVRREIFHVFVKALETNTKVPIMKENVASISLLAKEFCFEEMFLECSALMLNSAPESPSPP
jgi:hypothetical protein